MNRHWDVRADLRRRSIRGIVKVVSIAPALRGEGPRVLHLPTDFVKASVGPFPMHPESGSTRRSCCEVETTLPKPPVSAVEIACEPAVLEQAITPCACVTRPANWSVASGSPAVLSRPDSPSHRGADSEPGKPSASCTASQVPAVYDASSRITRIAHRRKALPPGRIGQTEIDSHLNEARAAKGVLRENAMLVAVFRSTPVELISRMRFDGIHRLLLFRLVPCAGLRSTRVYDMAAVRDLLTGRLHLIPNRARYREVSLS
jgi:hypothetical protein